MPVENGPPHALRDIKITYKSVTVVDCITHKYSDYIIEREFKNIREDQTEFGEHWVIISPDNSPIVYIPADRIITIEVTPL